MEKDNLSQNDCSDCSTLEDSKSRQKKGKNSGAEPKLTGEKLYHCPHCSQTSSRAHNMKVHIKRKHKEIGQPIKSASGSESTMAQFIPADMNSLPRNDGSHYYSPVENYNYNYHRHHETYQTYTHPSGHNSKNESESSTSIKRDSVDELLSIIC